MVGWRICVFSERPGIASNEIWSSVFISFDAERNRPSGSERELLGTYPTGVDVRLIN